MRASALAPIHRRSRRRFSTGRAAFVRAWWRAMSKSSAAVCTSVANSWKLDTYGLPVRRATANPSAMQACIPSLLYPHMSPIRMPSR